MWIIGKGVKLQYVLSTALFCTPVVRTWHLLPAVLVYLLLKLLLL